MKELTVTQWQEQIVQDDQAVILDVRTEEEVDDGMIEGANHLDIYKGQEFIDSVKELDASKHYYVYCRSGARSAQACTIMNQIGIETTYNLIGGYTAWNAIVNK